MPTPVVMPQMGESIAEGTIVRWIKKVGDAVDRDEPLFEISTDKVDAEIPSPAAGVLTEITVNEGETVPVNSVVGTIGAGGRSRRAAAPRAGQRRRAGAAKAAASTQPQADGAARRTPAPAVGEAAPPRRAAPRARHAEDDLRRQKSSPLVRRIARENNVDIAQIPAPGIGGRVTKHDILGYLEQAAEAPGAAGSRRRRQRRPAPAESAPASSRRCERVEIQPLSVMRKKIAEHMVLSRRTSAHVHSVFHVELLDRRAASASRRRPSTSRLGAKLTYMAFIAKAVIDALRAASDRQRLARRRQRRLQEGHQPRHRRGARRRADRAGRSSTPTRRTCSA